MQLGSDIEDSVVEERLKQQRADQCVSIVFSVSSLAVFKHDCTGHGDPSSHFLISTVWYNWPLQEYIIDS